MGCLGDGKSGRICEGPTQVIWYQDAFLPLIWCLNILSGKVLLENGEKFGFLTVQAIFPTSYLIYRKENSWTAAQRALILMTAYLNFYDRMYFSSNLLFESFLTVQAKK